MLKAASVAFLAVCLSAAAAHAQPFGITQGTPRASLNVEEEYSSTRMRVKPPRSHPEFEWVTVTLSPAEGACMVKGVGITHANDKYGLNIRSAIAELKTQLDATYGRSRLNDFINPGGIYRSASDWVMAIHKGERAYQFAWGNKDGPAIANGVVEILATVQALDHEDAYITLQFRFANHKKCETEIRQARARAF